MSSQSHLSLGNICGGDAEGFGHTSPKVILEIWAFVAALLWSPGCSPTLFGFSSSVGFFCDPGTEPMPAEGGGCVLKAGSLSAPPFQHCGLAPLEVGRSPPMGWLAAGEGSSNPKTTANSVANGALCACLCDKHFLSCRHFFRPGPAFQPWCCSSCTLVYLFDTLEKMSGL